MTETPPRYSHPGVKVTVEESSVTVEATNGALHDWATRPGNAWPCSVLSGLASLRADFDTNGLVDLADRGEYGDGDSDLSGDELSAFTSDCLAYALSPEHPCYFVTVGQFA